MMTTPYSEQNISVENTNELFALKYALFVDRTVIILHTDFVANC